LLKALLLISVFLSLCAYLPSAAFLAASLLFGAWSLILWRRFRPDLEKGFQSLPAHIRRIRDALLKDGVRWLLPVTRLVMDIGSEVGRIQAFGIYVRNRFFTRPVILTFHDIRASETTDSAEPDEYTCSGQQFLQMIEDARREGRWVVPLTEITRRLRTSPASLSFERVVAVTFDDGYRSVHGFLKKNLSLGDTAVAVFIPTRMLGKVNEWDRCRGSKPRAIMTCEAARELSSMGVTIGSHTRSHADLLSMKDSQAQSEIEGSLDDLKGNFMQKHDDDVLLSYPYGRHDQHIIRMVSEAGYAAAFTNLPGHLAPGMNQWQIPRFTVRDGMTWSDIRKASRKLWMREFARDLRRHIT
jgi:peptidoglycan/xylan/chitin deacetylase (PgdA/CDA1 family)